ncbi:Type 1 glutamine amidotransferase-like domain-containing protein [Cryobacterium sp. 10S3]|uniref:Type 1 glutamine amidotransferase-like domain-containing protein n=1 Tax=unclassified Cryobacterium TaxID=2649013 RepID=UPI002AC8C9B7|nr:MULTISPECIES: Type 1 glutamine amidotransferase-like domain-containing protein [unclassified Cryobacterium]MEB0002682.1 Type 1 glutamine amidotransferase-like domain-containing protein [Cryobacterium sp. RTC2.1]MEB0201078.1 Type 1 glutamine amidotransferase-like domain-containing protein [Cryobacterium sp. 5I3]MEB0286658.1 Type 1 glutamine amidotransferase-like domain-containing protein [Cryobacterium sp. 10S3]WPX14254.1 Type 1 glutamine amidotransferase-like domain-containing protein [Cryob
MSIHLVGGGWAAEHSAAVFGPFLAEATVRATAAGRDEPRIAIIAVRAPGTAAVDDAAQHAAKLAEALGAAGVFEAKITELALSDAATLPAIADVDGIIVGGGLTPAYLAALTPIAGEIRRQVSAGVPYLGYSAGAMIAAERALVGGWRLGEVEVSAEAASEGLDELTIQSGIGLLDVTVDVHAAQWGTLSRLIAATEAGLIDGGLAVDENTALIVGEGALRVVGSGSVWRVSQSENGVLVSTFGA